MPVREPLRCDGERLYQSQSGVADEATVQKIIAALENESLKYETHYKLIIATGMRRGECCGLKWSDIDCEKSSIHIQRNVVKITGEDIIVKDTKTASGDRYVYFSLETPCVEEQAEMVWLHRRLEKRLGRKRRRELLELVDAEARLQDDLPLTSFIAGLCLACGITHELGLEPPDSFRQEEEQQIRGV